MYQDKKVVDFVKDFIETLTVRKLMAIVVLGLVAFVVVDFQMQISESEQLACGLENVVRKNDGLPEEAC